MYVLPNIAFSSLLARARRYGARFPMLFGEHYVLDSLPRARRYGARSLFCSTSVANGLERNALPNSLAEVNFHDLLAGFVRNYDLFWHIASFLYYVFIFINSASERGAILRCANAG